MTFEETIAASKRLDGFLKQAKDEIMPEIGGKKLAGQFGDLLASLRKASEDAKTELAAAGAEFVTEVANVKKVTKTIRDETAEVRKAFGEILGNNPPEETPPGVP